MLLFFFFFLLFFPHHVYLSLKQQVLQYWASAQLRLALEATLFAIEDDACCTVRVGASKKEEKTVKQVEMFKFTRRD